VRVLITGVGGELGTRVASLLEADGRIDELLGLDAYPPRRLLRRTVFHRIDPRDRQRTAAVVREFGPTAVVHLGIYEPGARSRPGTADEQTAEGTVAALGSAVESPGLDRIVIRSGIEVYGRARHAPTRPDETIAPQPTSGFGRVLLHAESVADHAGQAADVPVTTLRFAPIVGPHFPSPLGRYLRLPVVPISLWSGLPFSLLHQEDAAAAVVAALHARHHGPVNVVGEGAVTAFQATRIGDRVPAPVVGPGWLAVGAAVELLGSPLPDHVREVLQRGRVADGGRVEEILGLSPSYRTDEVVHDLFDWPSVVYLEPRREAAAA
jgi:UDP-glucose 4-epimerase